MDIVKFYQKLTKDLTNLFETGKDYDVIIEVGPTQNRHAFKVHSIILNSRCSYLREELDNIRTSCNKMNLKTISKPHITANVFEIIIKYIYGGIPLFTDVDAPTILGLLSTAKEFGLDELVDTAQACLVQNNASWMRQNMIKVYILSLETDEFKDLQQFCNDMIAKDPSIIFDSEDFVNLSENALVSLLKLDNLRMNEGKIWDYVIRWGISQTPDLNFEPSQWSNENFSALKNTLKNCLPHIRYFQIAGEDVMDKLFPYQQIFEPNLWKDILTRWTAPNRVITSTILPPRNFTNLSENDISATTLCENYISATTLGEDNIPSTALNEDNISYTTLSEDNISDTSLNEDHISVAISATTLNDDYISATTLSENNTSASSKNNFSAINLSGNNTFATTSTRYNFSATNLRGRKGCPNCSGCNYCYSFSKKIKTGPGSWVAPKGEICNCDCHDRKK